MTFDELQFNPHRLGEGEQAMHTFANGYGVSVIITPFSYGGLEGKYELAVIKNKALCYSTSITNDVIGHLTSLEVTELLIRVEALLA